MAVRYTSRLSCVDSLAVTLLDVLGELDEIKICTAYEIGGHRVTVFPSHVDDLRLAQPVYETSPGWRKEISHVRRRDRPDAYHGGERFFGQDSTINRMVTGHPGARRGWMAKTWMAKDMADTSHAFPFASIDDAISQMRAGQMVVVVDDEDRENEGDLTIAAEMITPEAVNFMATHGRGLICLAMMGERLDELELAPSPAAKWLGVSSDRAGRVCVGDDLSLPDLPTVFVVGDTATREQHGKPLPGVAQVAMQGGRYVGNLIHRRIMGKTKPGPFRHFDKGNMAVVGKGFAIVQSGRLQMSGFAAWLAWAFIHVRYLATRNLRASVLLQWLWTYLTGVRGSRLIVDLHAPATEAAGKP